MCPLKVPLFQKKQATLVFFLSLPIIISQPLTLLFYSLSTTEVVAQLQVGNSFSLFLRITDTKFSDEKDKKKRWHQRHKVCELDCQPYVPMSTYVSYYKYMAHP